MKKHYLFPNSFRKIGWLLLIPALSIGIPYLFFDWEPKFLECNMFAIFEESFPGNSKSFALVYTNIIDELASILLIVSLIFIAFSKEKKEDEFISKIRLDSLVWATYTNFIVLILSILFLFDLAFFWALIFNMFTILVFFVIRFNLVLYKSNKILSNEK
mgnify:CR=1 FL=1